MKSEEIISELKKRKNQKNIDGMSKFGINPVNTLGVSVGVLRETAKRIKKEEKEKKKLHQIALQLWSSGIHEARILATIVDTPELVTENQIEDWVKDLDSWDVCDGLCMNLVDKTPFAYQKAKDWAKRDDEFIRRAGFATMASLAIHDKQASDKKFEEFFPVLKKYSTDERNFVRKSVNWSLRQIGKRNKSLLEKAISVAKEIEKLDSKSARWIAKDALRELERKR